MEATDERPVEDMVVDIELTTVVVDVATEA